MNERGWATAAATIVLGCVATGARATATIDLVPSLLRAERCAETSAACEAAVRELRRKLAIVRLRPATRRHIYLRVPDAARLRLQLAGAGVVVSVETDDLRERDLFRSTDSGWQRATVDLSPVSGRIARLAFRTGPQGAGAKIRGALLDAATGPRAGEIRADGAAGTRPNVVVYVIDTLRADHLGCYGYARPTSPRIDEFARSALRFSHAVAQSSWTLPSIASILTGLDPPAHGATGPERGIRPDVPTLAARLHAKGYTTAAFVTNYLGSDVFGLDRGFATYRFYAERGDRRRAVYLGSDRLSRRVMRWLARAPREPFFLYVHASDPHFPYVPPRRHARSFVAPAAARGLPSIVDAVRPLHDAHDAWGTRPARVAPADLVALRDAYDGDVRMADAGFGRLLDALAARGLAARTLVMLTSDHGEEFLEHRGVAHGQTLYAESVHVPLLIRLPDGRTGGRTVDTLAQHVDIAPTVLDVTGVPVSDGMAGSSLVRPTAADVEAHPSLRLGRFALDGLVVDRWKVIRDAREDVFEIYATDRDPGERVDLAANMPVLVGYARTRFADLAALRTQGAPVSPADVGRLQTLGYVTD